MKSKYKPYPSYKESGVEWLGEIPEGWEARRLKTILEERKEKNNPIKTEYILSLCMYRGVIPYSEKGNSGNKAKDDLTAYKLAYPNDIVVNSMNVVAGSVGLSKYFGAVSPVYYMLHPRKSSDNIFYYNAIFQSESFQKSLIGLGNGILVKQSEKTGKLNTIRMKISMESLNNVLLPIPPLQEQKAIATYLDRATQKIDTLINKQNRLITLLKEKRQALISHAVTKGVDGNGKLRIENGEFKDSGVEWLGKIPRWWKVKKFKYIAKIQGGKDQKSVLDNKSKYPIYGSGGIFGYANQFLYNGESVLLGRKGTIDKPLYVNDKFWTVDTMYYTIPKKNTIVKWFYYVSTTINFDFYQYGSAVPSMTQEDLHNIYFATPPKEEQKAIATYLDQKTQAIDTLIDKATKSIELLKEKRTALISAVVTGKVDVRDIHD